MLRIVYAGSPAISVAPLLQIAERHTVVAVLTNPPSRQGRSKTLIHTPVAQAAQAHGIPVLESEKLDESVRNHIASLKPDVLLCFAYSKIFGPRFLALYPLGGINIHPSLLPRYRGPCPVPAALLNRDAETGITIQTLAAKMDSGDILCQVKIPLAGTETAESLLEYVSMHSGALVLDVLDRIEKGTVQPVVQNESDATYCALLSKKDAEIRWEDSALNIDARIRAFYPWPGSCTAADGAVLIIHKAQVFTGDISDAIKVLPEFYGVTSACGTVIGVDPKNGILVQTGTGILALQMLQWQTKKILDWKTFLNGSHNFIGTRLKSHFIDE